MVNRYYLMWKNEIITLLQFDDNGKLTAYSRNISESAMDIAPLAYRSTPEKWLYKWWEERSIPVTRDQLKKVLSGAGFSTPEQYLIKNLGLSLTDYYWIKPVDSNLTWNKVNLFDNDFHDNTLLYVKKPVEDGVFSYSPNSSLQGNIEKSWSIIDGKRCLVKGNSSGLSSESINEVIASKIYEMQGYNNYTSYSLIKINNKPYKYGCISELFTSQSLEAVSAWAVCTSEKQDNNTSLYEHFIAVCKNHGMDESQLRRDLEYQIMGDYILSGYDRHLNNLSVLRDAETHRFVRLAPLYDSGDCLFANRPLPANLRELQKMEISSFTNREGKQLKLVRDRSLLNTDRLPSSDYIRKMYHKDEKISDNHIETIISWYEKKIELLNDWQNGKVLYK